MNITDNQKAEKKQMCVSGSINQFCDETFFEPELVCKTLVKCNCCCSKIFYSEASPALFYSLFRFIRVLSKIIEYIYLSPAAADSVDFNRVSCWWRSEERARNRPRRRPPTMSALLFSGSTRDCDSTFENLFF